MYKFKRLLYQLLYGFYRPSYLVGRADILLYVEDAGRLEKRLGEPQTRIEILKAHPDATLALQGRLLNLSIETLISQETYLRAAGRRLARHHALYYLDPIAYPSPYPPKLRL
jgi:hypothetical protein